jgi:hypothetical protein
MQSFLMPYNLAKELDDHFKPLHINDFVNLVEVFQAAGNEKNQHEVFDLFKTLSKEEVISRAYKISKLSRALVLIKKNNRRHDLPST